LKIHVHEKLPITHQSRSVVRRNFFALASGMKQSAA